MLPRDLRRKLSKVNRERGTTEPADDSEIRTPHSAIRNRLEDVVPGRVHVHEHGELYVCERRIEELHLAGNDEISSAIQEVRRVGCEPGEALFLDIETCGLANCPLFLVGIMAQKGDEIRVQQFFARDYTEEKSLLLHLADVLSAYRMFITFNGKAFDIPYMRDRMIFHRLESLAGGFEQEQFDVLHHARRLWRDTLPDCRLQTLEEHICGRRRHGDIPGHLIPELYHDFVRTGNAAPLEGVFRHNALDLITMAELLPKVLG